VEERTNEIKEGRSNELLTVTLIKDGGRRPGSRRLKYSEM
jgi:hypothetical protein